MEIKKINKILYKEALNADMCERVKNEWHDTLSEQALIDLWYDNYDFVIANHFPANENIKKCFKKNILRGNNVLVDDSWSLLNPEKAMILGESESNIRFNGYHVGHCWVRDRSLVNVYVKDNADVTICVMDNAKVHVINYSNMAKVLVMKYAPQSVITHNGMNIRIREHFGFLK